MYNNLGRKKATTKCRQLKRLKHIFFVSLRNGKYFWRVQQNYRPLCTVEYTITTIEKLILRNKNLRFLSGSHNLPSTTIIILWQNEGNIDTIDTVGS